MMNNLFLTQMDDVGTWDVESLIQELKTLVERTGCDWKKWSANNNITSTKWKSSENTQYLGNINLTCNVDLSNNLEDQLWAYSGRKYVESLDVNHYDLHTLNPSLKGTSIEQLYLRLVKLFGPIYLRIHNKANNYGLYLHKDDDSDYEPGNYRYHLVLWTNPGHQIVWTPDEMPWKYGVVPEHNTTSYKLYAEFLPANGKCYRLATGKYVHGVSSMGIGWRNSDLPNSRCHIVAIPIVPNNRYGNFVMPSI